MKVWRALSGEQRRAGIAAAALLATLFLPWYRTSPLGGQAPFRHQNLTAFGVFSFVEAAVLVVSAAVLYLLYARALDGDLFAQCLYVGCMVHAIQSIGNFMYMILNPVIMFGPVLYLCIEFLTVRQEGGQPARRRLATCPT